MSADNTDRDKKNARTVVDQAMLRTLLDQAGIPTVDESIPSADILNEVRARQAGIPIPIVDEIRPGPAVRRPKASAPLIGNGSRFRSWPILETISKAGSQADIYKIDYHGTEAVLRLYRQDPKPEVFNRLTEISQKLGDLAVRVFEAGRDVGGTDSFYEVQEFIRYGDLAKLMAIRNSLGTGFSETEFKDITGQITEALSRLHNMGIIHRDLKPNNILVRSDLPDRSSGRPLKIALTDFGIASFLGGDVTKKVTRRANTPLYAAPESIANNLAGMAGDWWSLGAMLLEIQMRGHPLAGLGEFSIIREICTDGLRVPDNLPSDKVLLLKGLLTQKPDKTKGRWRGEQVRQWLAGARDIPIYYREEPSGLSRGSARPSSRKDPGDSDDFHDIREPVGNPWSDSTLPVSSLPQPPANSTASELEALVNSILDKRGGLTVPGSYVPPAPAPLYETPRPSKLKYLFLLFVLALFLLYNFWPSLSKTLNEVKGQVWSANANERPVQYPQISRGEMDIKLEDVIRDNRRIEEDLEWEKKKQIKEDLDWEEKKQNIRKYQAERANKNKDEVKSEQELEQLIQQALSQIPAPRDQEKRAEDKAKLAKKNDKLAEENAKLAKENAKLTKENAKLAEEKAKSDQEEKRAKDEQAQRDKDRRDRRNLEWGRLIFDKGLEFYEKRRRR